MSEPIVCRSAAEFAAHLTAARKAQGIGLRDFAADLGMDKGQLSRREHGQHIPLISHAIRHAAALGYGLALIPLPRPPLVVDAHLPDEDVIP